MGVPEFGGVLSGLACCACRGLGMSKGLEGEDIVVGGQVRCTRLSMPQSVSGAGASHRRPMTAGADSDPRSDPRSSSSPHVQHSELNCSRSVLTPLRVESRPGPLTIIPDALHKAGPKWGIWQAEVYVPKHVPDARSRPHA